MVSHVYLKLICSLASSLLSHRKSGHNLDRIWTPPTTYLIILLLYCTIQFDCEQKCECFFFQAQRLLSDVLSDPLCHVVKTRLLFGCARRRGAGWWMKQSLFYCFQNGQGIFFFMHVNVQSSSMAGHVNSAYKLCSKTLAMFKFRRKSPKWAINTPDMQIIAVLSGTGPSGMGETGPGALIFCRKVHTCTLPWSSNNSNNSNTGACNLCSNYSYHLGQVFRINLHPDIDFALRNHVFPTKFRKFSRSGDNGFTILVRIITSL